MRLLARLSFSKLGEVADTHIEEIGNHFVLRENILGEQPVDAEVVSGSSLRGGIRFYSHQVSGIGVFPVVLDEEVDVLSSAFRALPFKKVSPESRNGVF